jgi:hypothetical protein
VGSDGDGSHRLTVRTPLFQGGDRGSIPRGSVESIRGREYAGIAQLVERNLAKVEVAGSSPVARSDGKVQSEKFEVQGNGFGLWTGGRTGREGLHFVL